MKKIWIATAAVALSLSVLAGCSAGGGGGGGAAKQVAVTMGENGAMAFNPQTINVKKGDKVTLNLSNKDSAQSHSFVINELNVKAEQVPAGQSTTISVPTDKKGSFTYYCDVPGHKDSGMTGTLVVE